MVHTAIEAGALSLEGAEGKGIGSVFQESYEAGGYRYRFACYATENCFSISLGEDDRAIGYRDCSIERISFFE